MAKAGEVWMIDLGMVAKVRPCLLLTDYPADDELALIRASDPNAQDLICPEAMTG
jgi:mRNA-degrading endonuclease toxin of MazEF toxin-antitoxin module